MLTHGNLLANARTLHGWWGWQPSDVLIHVLPVFHVHGLFVASHGALLAGAKMLWFNKFEPKATIAQLPRATVFMGVPTLYVRMLAEPTLTRDRPARRCGCSWPGRRRCCPKPSKPGASAPGTPSSSATA